MSKKRYNGIITRHAKGAKELQERRMKVFEVKDLVKVDKTRELGIQKAPVLGGFYNSEMSEGVCVELIDPFSKHLENLKNQMQRAEESATLFPEVLQKVFAQTRDGFQTSVEQKMEIIRDPLISESEVFESIRLGVKAWGGSLFHERRG